MNLYVIDPTEKLFKQFNTEKKSEFNTIFAHLLKSVTQKNLLTPGDFILADSDNAETWLKDVDLSKDIPAGVKLITTPKRRLQHGWIEKNENHCVKN